MILLFYPRCSTCKKALNWVNENGVAVSERDIVLRNPTEKELKMWHKRSGLPLKKFFNTSGMKYRGLGLKYKLKEMSEEEQYKLLATDGMLVKRPLLVGKDFVFIGFKLDEWKSLLK